MYIEYRFTGQKRSLIMKKGRIKAIMKRRLGKIEKRLSNENIKNLPYL